MNSVTRRQALQSGLALALSAAAAPVCAMRSDKNQPLIDCHVHLTLGYYSQEREPITATHLLHWMDAHELSHAVVLPLVSPEAFWYPVTTEYVLTATAPHRDRLVPFCAIDPRTLATHLTEKQDLVSLLSRYVEAGAKGFGEHKPQLAIDDPRSMRLYEACAQVGLPVLFHLDNQANVDKPGLPGLARVLKEFPTLSMIGHGKGWWASISGGLRQDDLHVGYPPGPVAPGGAVDALMTAYPNLYADLSSSGAHALLRDKSFGTGFLERWSNRLLFGTDYYLSTQVDFPQFTMFDELRASPKVRRKVGFENIVGLLRLSDINKR